MRTDRCVTAAGCFGIRSDAAGAAQTRRARAKKNQPSAMSLGLVFQGGCRAVPAGTAANRG
jgi:hypothetical protein